MAKSGYVRGISEGCEVYLGRFWSGSACEIYGKVWGRLKAVHGGADNLYRLGAAKCRIDAATGARYILGTVAIGHRGRR